MQYTEQKTVSPNGKNIYSQLFANGAVVEILKSKTTGQRGARVIKPGTTVRYIPLELLALCSGPDAWLGFVRFGCKQCGERFCANQGEGEFCATCFASFDPDAQ